jgi:hypothetical protein
VDADVLPPIGVALLPVPAAEAATAIGVREEGTEAVPAIAAAAACAETFEVLLAAEEFTCET